MQSWSCCQLVFGQAAPAQGHQEDTTWGPRTASVRGPSDYPATEACAGSGGGWLAECPESLGCAVFHPRRLFPLPVTQIPRFLGQAGWGRNTAGTWAQKPASLPTSCAGACGRLCPTSDTDVPRFVITNEACQEGLGVLPLPVRSAGHSPPTQLLVESERRGHELARLCPPSRAFGHSCSWSGWKETSHQCRLCCEGLWRLKLGAGMAWALMRPWHPRFFSA